MPPKRKASTRNSSSEKITKKQKTQTKAVAKKVAEKKPATKTKAQAKAEAKTTEKKSNVAKKVSEQIVKVVTKGGAAVDQYVANKDQFRVYQSGCTTYSATLNKSDLGHNNNKFYMIQILQNEKSGQLFTFNRWGRVGVPGQQATKGPFPSNMAINDYNKKLNDKTRGGYIPLEIKFDDEEEEKPKKKAANSKPKKQTASKLGPELQDLMRLVFDMKMIEKSMKEIGYDAKKCPLGKLGDNTINQAFKVLGEISKELNKKKVSKDVLSTESGKFYSLIPHDIGFAKMSQFILDTSEKVKQKMDMLQSLTDMKLASKIIEKSENSDENIVDQNYKSLKNKMTLVKPGTAEHKAIVDYIHDSGQKPKIKHIFTLDRDGDESRFNKKIGNDQLLWHGSRLQNYGGILSQGLRIAPPEAPVNGYAYGKGLYFANSFSTSNCYSYNCNTNQSLILLCKVAVGRLGPLQKVNMSGPCIDTKKYDTCIGFASKHFKDKNYTKLNGLKVPSKSAKEGCNAYITYNVNQAALKYVIWYER